MHGMALARGKEAHRYNTTAAPLFHPITPAAPQPWPHIRRPARRLLQPQRLVGPQLALDQPKFQLPLPPLLKLRRA